MLMKVENELMDGENIRELVAFYQKGTAQYSGASHQVQEVHPRWLVSGLWMSHR
jgi:hypothetical protein